MTATNKARLTERRVEQIQASGRQAWFGDVSSPLRLMVSPKGAKSWYVEGRVKCRPIRVKLGRWPDVTVETARRLATERAGQMAAGIDPAAERRKQRKRSYRVNEAIADYIADAEAGQGRSKPLKVGTIHEYRRINEVHLKRYHTLPVVELAGRHIDELRRAHSVSVANAAIRLLRAACNHAFSRDVIDANPLAGRRRIVTPIPPRTNHVSEADLGLLLLGIEATQDASVAAGEQVAGDALLLMLLYGLRKNEALSLPVSAVDLARDTFRIESNKSDRPLTLPITLVARSLFSRRLCLARRLGSKFVFPTIGNRRSARGWLAEPRRAADLVTKKTGLTFTPHALRRTFVSYVAQRISVTVVKAIVNHAATDHGDVTFTHYVNTSCEDMRGPLESVHQAMMLLKAGASVPQAKPEKVFALSA